MFYLALPTLILLGRMLELSRARPYITPGSETTISVQSRHHLVKLGKNPSSDTDFATSEIEDKFGGSTDGLYQLLGA